MEGLTPRPARLQKLSREDARKIIVEWHSQKASLRQLAERYSVTAATIHAVCRGRSHADVYREVFGADE